MINNPQAIVSFQTANGWMLAIVVGIVTTGSLASADDGDGPTSLSQLNTDLRVALKTEATTRGRDSHATSVFRLCERYVELRSDDRYATSEYLQALAVRARRRLIEVRTDVRQRLRRDGVPESSTSHDIVNDGRLGPGASDGWMLVELITRTIAPDSWSDRGGAGVVHYFGLKRALVVRATTTVHEDIQLLLRALGG